MTLMETLNTPSNTYAPDFELPGIDDKVYHLGRYLENYQTVAVVFIGNNCPHVNCYLDRLKQIQHKFESLGFSLIAINSNDNGGTLEDSFESMKSFAAKNELNFPYLRDPTQDVAKSFKATVTPEVFLLNKQAIVMYKGKIDDGHDSADTVQNAYLESNIEALLNKTAISPSFTEATGSPIKWRANRH
jgi:peroxiredoxin